MSERFFDSRANRDGLDRWLTTHPDERWPADDPDEPVDGGGDECVPEPDPLYWLVGWMLEHWTESAAVVLETLEEASAPAAVLRVVQRHVDGPFAPQNDPVFEPVGEYPPDCVTQRDRDNWDAAEGATWD